MRKRSRSLKSHFASSVLQWETDHLEDSRRDEEDANGLMDLLTDGLLEDAVRERATDVHLEPGSDEMCLRFRIDGSLYDAALIPNDVGSRLLGHIKALAQIDPIPLKRPAGGRITYPLGKKEFDLRVSCVPCIKGEKLAIRLLQSNRLALNLDEIGLSDRSFSTVSRWLDNIAGMFLVVGATGSGKTTTLYALLHKLKTRHRSVLTIEDPVEYRIDGISQMQVNERQGFTFAEGVKAMLRLDPDYLLVGEIRDAVSAQAALDVAASGKPLFSTLHSRDSAGAVTTLRNFGIEDYEIVTALELVVAQRLVRKLCVHCRRERAPTEGEKAWLESSAATVPETVFAPGECKKCRLTGYQGRTGLFEVWRSDDEFKEMILKHADENSIRKELRRRGVNGILHDAVEKAAAGVTSISELQSPGG